jgi:peroxiredoxin (alkyl hydroperoxide reductase subunit C)
MMRQVPKSHQPIVGRSVDETLRLIEAFEFTDKHGEVCPANWRPGKATIIPDQDKKNDFFNKIDDSL